MVDVLNSHGPRRRANQLYYGPMYADTYAIRNFALLGQGSPITRERMRKQHGRFLSGFGGAEPSGRVGYDPAYQGQEVVELEQQDDTFGSGIFDPGGRSGTANATMGVFASHFSLPGYAAREVPFTVSQDESDITDDAEVVIVPGGGMTYVESRGKLTRPAILGPTWRPPKIQPVGVTTRDQVYGFMTRPGQPLQKPFNPGAPQVPPPNYRPPRDDKYHARPLPTRSSCGVPLRPAQRRIPPQSMVTPTDPAVAIQPPGCRTGYGAADKEPASTGQLLAFGLIAGAATALVVNLTSKKRRRR